MSLFRIWHDTLGSAGGVHISPRLWGRVLANNPMRLLPFLYTEVVRGRLVNALARQRNRGKRFIPKQIIIEPTAQCNLSCSFCYLPRRTGIMSRDMFRRIIEQGRALGVSRFVLMGGEPTLPAVQEMVYPVIREFSSCSFTFCTNGTLVDDELISRWRGVRNVSFIISIDGPRAITDQLRGLGVFNQAWRGLERLLREGINTAVSITTAPELWQKQLSIPFMQRLRNLGIIVVYTHFIVSRGKDAPPAVDRVRLVLHLRELVRRFAFFLNEGHFGKMTPSGIVPREDHQVVIGPDGSLRGNRFDSRRTIGSLKKKTLGELLADPELIAYKRKRKSEANDHLADVGPELARRGFRLYRPAVLE